MTERLTSYALPTAPVDAMTVALEVSGVRTTTDGGIRITLDLPETATDLAAWLMACKAQGIALQTAFVKINPNAGQEEE